jgi:hypothetical protein
VERVLRARGARPADVAHGEAVTRLVRVAEGGPASLAQELAEVSAGGVSVPWV